MPPLTHPVQVNRYRHEADADTQIIRLLQTYFDKRLYAKSAPSSSALQLPRRERRQRAVT
jgi:hypothetical protein